MTRCCVPKCSEIGNHHFPKINKMRRLWLKAIRRRNFKITKSTRICRKHFLENDYEIFSKYTGIVHQHKYLKKIAIPSVFSWNTKQISQEAMARKNRYEARNFKKNPFQDNTATPQSFKYFIPLEPKVEYIEISEEIESATSETTNTGLLHKTHYTCGTQTLNLLRMFNTELLLEDDKSVNYFTGLETVSKFRFVLSTLLPMAHSIKYRWNRAVCLSIEDQFLMLLIKLRRNKPDFELSKMFGVNKSEVFNVIVTWINFVSGLWSLIDIWPNRQLINFYMPDSFRNHYYSTRVIIDEIEIPIQKPSHSDAQKATFSLYKDKNTLKFLVGASPGGLLTYCSEAYAGSVSDQQIVEQSNLLQLCEDGDSVMADSGFNVKDIFANTVVGKEKSQIPCVLLKNDQKFARKTVHIEKIIGLTKSYQILTSDLTQFYVPLASKIFHICLMLCNFREASVNKN